MRSGVVNVQRFVRDGITNKPILPASPARLILTVCVRLWQHMIEIEKNFDLKDSDKEKLIADATFLRKITLTDTYYDTKDFRLTTKDHWLRQRNGRFELKTPINGTATDRITDQYREIENDKEIINALSLPDDKPLIQTLST